MKNFGCFFVEELMALEVRRVYWGFGRGFDIAFGFVGGGFGFWVGVLGGFAGLCLLEMGLHGLQVQFFRGF